MNNTEYAGVMSEISELIKRGVRADTPEGDRLLELAGKARAYESARYPRVAPDPVSAIRFRMEQQGMQPRDLIPYLGNKSRVYEVLSGKRQLTLPMIRSLHKGLGIPAESLIGEPAPVARHEGELDWSKFPVSVMRTRGWISTPQRATVEQTVAALRGFMSPLAGVDALAMLFRKSAHVRAALATDRYAMLAWTAKVVGNTNKTQGVAEFKPQAITEEFLREVARLSWLEAGPKLAEEYLAKHGIALVIEPQLPGSRLDGAAFWFRKQAPVIALTIRYNRLDSFWFTLLHELVHVAKHLSVDRTACFDDLDAESVDEIEKEADQIAGDALIPPHAWAESSVLKAPSPFVVEGLARSLRIHPAIVAGRVRHELGNYKLLSKHVGQGEVRRLFPGAAWPKGKGVA